MKKDFSLIPQVRFNRSKIPLGHGVKTSMSVGKLYPISCVEVLPGDTFKSKVNVVARATTSFLKPVIDNAFVDVFHFFVPYRLCYDKSQDVFGVARPSSYSNDNLDEFPTVTATNQVVYGKTVADYLGFPLGGIPSGFSVLPFRAFALIWNDWFRNENVTDETYVQTGNAGIYETLNNSDWSQTNYFGKLPNVSKKKDYFTSCLPQTQKGLPVKTPLGQSLAPVVPTDGQGLYFNIPSQPTYDGFRLITGDLKQDWGLSGKEYELGLFDSKVRTSPIPNDTPLGYQKGLSVDLSNVLGASVNDLRFAFQMQKMLERDALYGSRYNEYLLGHFGVSAPDMRCLVPEYLGGGRFPISIQQVAQTSEGTSTSPIANVGAFSLSNGQSKFSKGFVEHGYVMTVACIRTMHTYQQGVQKMFYRKKRNDFYDPLFANLGEQPVYRSEIFAENESSFDENVFGYNEAWADYRSIPSRVSGELRSLSQNSLDIWHFADKYENAPILSQDFIEENSSNIDRTLAVPSTSQDNFLCDFWFDTEAIRVMPAYSVPGLIDHH